MQLIDIKVEQIESADVELSYKISIFLEGNETRPIEIEVKSLHNFGGVIADAVNKFMQDKFKRGAMTSLDELILSRFVLCDYNSIEIWRGDALGKYGEWYYEQVAANRLPGGSDLRPKISDYAVSTEWTTAEYQYRTEMEAYQALEKKGWKSFQWVSFCNMCCQSTSRPELVLQDMVLNQVLPPNYQAILDSFGKEPSPEEIEIVVNELLGNTNEQEKANN